MKYGLPGTLCFAFFFLTATAAHAAVVLNEIAWMGTDAGSLCEWLELHNTGGEDVDLAGWTLQIRDGVQRPLTDGVYDTLIITAGGYFVIERLVPSCEDPVPGVSDLRLAFGDIQNTNTSIALYDAGGAEVDRVTSGADWKMGGDVTIGKNAAPKETAQRTLEGWTTGTPTPRGQNVAYAAPQPPASGSGDTTGSGSSSGGSSTPPRAKQVTTSSAADRLVVRLTGPTTGYVNQPLEFTASASGITAHALTSVQYAWAFGDLAAAAGDEATHAYAYPGQYVLVLSATRMPHEVELRRELTILPVALALSRNADGDLVIRNDGAHEVDLSGFTVHAGGASFQVPAETIVLSGASVTLSRRDFPAAAYGSVMISDRMHTAVAWYPNAGASVTAVRAASSVLLPEPAAEVEPPPAAYVPPVPSSAYTLRAAAADAGERSSPASSPWPYAALIAVVGLGILALLVRRP